MKPVSDLIRFLVELATICLIIANGLKFDNFLFKVLGVLIAILVILFWSRFMAPKSLNRWPEVLRLMAERVIFGGTAAGTIVLYGLPIGLTYLVIATISTIADHLIK